MQKCKKNEIIAGMTLVQMKTRTSGVVKCNFLAKMYLTTLRSMLVFVHEPGKLPHAGTGG